MASLIDSLSFMQFRTPHVGYFPLLPAYTRHSIAWGKGSPNMSSRVGPHKERAEQATKDFLHTAGIDTRHVIKIDPSGIPELELLHVTSEMLEENTLKETFSNFLYTTDPSVTLLAKPGDCPVAVIAAELPNNKPLIGLLHAGRVQLDKQVPVQAITFLQSLDCDIAKVKIGIAPSIAFVNYFIHENDAHLLSRYVDWEKYKRVEKRDGKIFLNLLGYFLDQLLESGISPENIQAYSLDTLAAAQRNEAYSQRFASYSKNEDNNGRFLVAVELV